MYLDHWGLQERPFQNAYDPAYLYRWDGHEEVISRLRYNLDGERGFVLITGPTGCGKTFLCRTFAEAAAGKGARVCLIANPIDDPDEIFHQIRAGLGVDGTVMSRADLIRSIEETAANSHRNRQQTIVIIDDAHLLGHRSIHRELRQLLNLEEEGSRLISLVLAGQDVLGDSVDESPEIAQRIAIRARAEALPAANVGEYVKHRLSVAGLARSPFKKNALDEIARVTGGVPRTINDLCDVALFSGWGRKKKEIGKKDIDEAVGDIISVDRKRNAG